ncbi:MAG: copper-binding protein [Phycisphaerales bacterium]
MHRRLALGAILLALTLAIPACAKKKPEAQTPDPVARYTVRGKVLTLPVAGDVRTELRIRHEAIPDFRANILKDPVGMRAMAMPFPITDHALLRGISVDDAVEVTFEVTYSKEDGAIRDSNTVAIKRLPPETPLDFGPAKPAAPSEPPAETPAH